jgi:hypothetical protein
LGFGDFVSDITPDVVEDAGGWTADRLDDVGWESGGDWVRAQSRSLANRMGAQVDELDLGQTDDRTKLIYGSPSKLRSTAKNLKDLQRAFDDVGQGLGGLDSSAIIGDQAAVGGDTNDARRVDLQPFIRRGPGQAEEPALTVAGLDSAVSGLVIV